MQEDHHEHEAKQYKIACRNCRSLHRKCDKILPACTSCVQKGVECNYVPPKKRVRQSGAQSEYGVGDSASFLEPDKEQTLGEILMNRFSETNPTSPPDTLEYKIERIAWIALNAVSIRIFGSNSRRWKVLPNSSLPRLDLDELRSKYSVQDLKVAADEMYATCREFIIRPSIFYLLTSNEKLVMASLLVIGYSVHMQRNIPEAKLLLHSLTTFFDNREAKPDGDFVLFLFRVQKLMICAQGMEYNMTSLQETLSNMRQLFDTSPNGAHIKSHSKRLEHLLMTEQGLSLVFKFMSLCKDDIENEKNPISENQFLAMNPPKSVRELALLHLQFFLLQIELNNTQDDATYTILYNLRLKISKKMTDIVSSEPVVTSALISKVALEVFKVHMAHCNVLAQANSSSNIILEGIAMLTTDVYIAENVTPLTELLAPVEIQELISGMKSLINALSIKQEIVRKMENQLHQSTVLFSDLLEWNTL